MSGTINVLVRADEDDELTSEERGLVMAALKREYDRLNEAPEGDKQKAMLLLNAATKLGFYTPE